MRDNLDRMNPWWENKPVPLPSELLERHVLRPLQEHLASDDVTLITGPRQVGKTVLVRRLVQHLLEPQSVDAHRIWYLNLDVGILHGLLESPARLPAMLEAMGWDGTSRAYVFIDEVQRLDDAGLRIKALHDLGLPIKLILTGSSQLEIRTRVAEHLTGRSRRFQVFPLGFEETAAHRFGLRLEDSGYWNVRKLMGPAVHEHVQERLVFGGYPRVVLASTEKEKRLLLGDLLETYLQRDIRDLLGIDNLTGFMNLLRALASRSASQLNLNELASTTSLAWETVRSYLDALELTFVIFRLRPFFAGSNKEIRKMARLHFLDTGFRNVILQDLSSSPHRADIGALVETAHASRRFARRHGQGALMYWRTTSGAELDLVEVMPGNRLTAVEVKTRMGRMPNALGRFSTLYDHTDRLEVRLLEIDEPRSITTKGRSVHLDHVFA